jgi:transposase
LSERQKATLESLPTRHLKTARAYQIRLAFQDLYEQSAEAADSYLRKWYFWGGQVQGSRIPFDPQP